MTGNVASAVASAVTSTDAVRPAGIVITSVGALRSRTAGVDTRRTRTRTSWSSVFATASGMIPVRLDNVT